MSATYARVTPSLPCGNPNASRTDERLVQLTRTDGHMTRTDGHVTRTDGHVTRTDEHVTRTDGHVDNPDASQRGSHRDCN